MRAQFVSLALALGVACGSSSATRVGKQPAWRTPDAADAAGADRGGAPGERFAPTTPSVSRYNDPLIAPAPSSPLADAIVAEIRDVAAAAGAVAPRPDGRLYAAARELATIVPEDSPLSYRLVEFAMQRHGIIEPSPHLVVIWGPFDDPTAIMQQLRDKLPELVASGPFARIGVGSARRGGESEGATILALQASHLTTKPIPRALPNGGTITIEGKLMAPFRDPEVFVTRENGGVEQPQLTRQGEGGFSARVGCVNHRGRQQLEVTAVDATGSTVLANFPVWCNQSPPTSVEVVAGDSQPVVSAAAAEKRMVDLVNRDRARHKLPALLVDSRVAAVARAHSQEMFDTGLVAHVSPRTGSASDRVSAVKIQTAVVLENVARAYGVVEAQEGLMNSPGHRANLLTKQATHIGVGIVIGQEVAGRSELFVTQVFIHIAPVVSIAKTKQLVRRKVAEVSKLVHGDELARVAQGYADDIVGGLSSAEASARAAKKSDKLAQRYARASTVVTTVANLDAFAPRSVLGDGRMTHFGVGVAQGPHKDLGERAIYIVLILAEAR